MLGHRSLKELESKNSNTSEAERRKGRERETKKERERGKGSARHLMSQRARYDGRHTHRGGAVWAQRRKDMGGHQRGRETAAKSKKRIAEWEAVDHIQFTTHDGRPPPPHTMKVHEIWTAGPRGGEIRLFGANRESKQMALAAWLVTHQAEVGQAEANRIKDTYAADTIVHTSKKMARVKSSLALADVRGKGPTRLRSRIYPTCKAEEPRPHKLTRGSDAKSRRTPTNARETDAMDRGIAKRQPRASKMETDGRPIEAQQHAAIGTKRWRSELHFSCSAPISLTIAMSTSTLFSARGSCLPGRLCWRACTPTSCPSKHSLTIRRLESAGLSVPTPLQECYRVAAAVEIRGDTRALHLPRRLLFK